MTLNIHVSMQLSYLERCVLFRDIQLVVSHPVQYFLSLSHSVTLTISELRSEAQPFATGIVKHITTVAVVQQCCESVYYTHVHDNSLGVYNVIYTITNTCIPTCMYNVYTCFFSYRLSQSPEATVSQFMCIYMYI